MSAPKVWADDRLALAVHLKRQGWAYDKIAEATGYDRSQVRNRLYRIERGDEVWYEQRKKPRARYGRTTRSCLCCKRDFSSEWIGNRLCTDCKTRGHAPIEVGF